MLKAVEDKSGTKKKERKVMVIMLLLVLAIMNNKKGVETRMREKRCFKVSFTLIFV